MEPLVSVIMPAYNAAMHLREAVDSILNQSYKNIELIAVNDGSTDNTLDILKEYAEKDQRVIIISRENKGVAESLNDGLKCASGEFIARMDADDYSLPDRVKKQVEFLENNKEVGMCGTNIFINDKKKVRKYPLNDIDIRKFLYLGSAFAHPTVMIRKEIMDKYNLSYDTNYPAEDYELWTRLVGFTKVANMEEPLLIYRVDGNNISIKKQQLLLDTNHRIRKKYCMETGIEYGLEAPFELYNSENRGKVLIYFKQILDIQGSNQWCFDVLQSALFEALFYESSSYKDMKSQIMDFLNNYFDSSVFTGNYNRLLKKKYFRRKIKLFIKRK